MKRFKAYKFALMPNGSQQKAMTKVAGCCRYVFNRALALQKAQHESNNSYYSRTDLLKLVTKWRKETDTIWLAEAHSQALQSSITNLELALQNFLKKRANFPQFRQKGKKESFRFPQGFKLNEANNKVYLPKIGWVRYRKSRPITGSIRNMTVSLHAGRWFVSILTETDTETPAHQGGEVGIDMGVTRFATFSDGTHLEPLNSFRKHEQALKKAQRAMSRKTKFSNNWKKAKARVQRVHARIGNVRRDYLHKATTAISKNHALVVIEDLQVGNMSSSGKHKRGLNKSILDQGWYEFRRQLDYKTAWNGGFLVAVPPHYTSQRCIACGHTTRENRQTQASFVCVDCGFEANADYVGAVNILRAGLARLACGDISPVRVSAQEPTEETNLRLALG